MKFQGFFSREGLQKPPPPLKSGHIRFIVPKDEPCFKCMQNILSDIQKEIELNKILISSFWDYNNSTPKYFFRFVDKKIQLSFAPISFKLRNPK